MLKNISFICNEKQITRIINPSLTLLDFLRKELLLTGTKEGCREGDCGACTVLLGELTNEHVTYKTVNSCLLPLQAVHGKHVITIEGLNQDRLNPIQQLMVVEGGTQCGFCTPGFIMSMTDYFLSNKSYKTEELIQHLDGNICRCTGYASIKRAAAKAAEYLTSHNGKDISHVIMPSWFQEVPARLKSLRGEIPFQTGTKPQLLRTEPEFTYTAGNSNELNREINPALVSGGTDLYVQKWEELYTSDIELPAETEGEKISLEDGKVIVSALSTVSELMNSELMNSFFPHIKGYFKLFGSTPIRNRATVGGNIVNASPIADMTSFFLALDSTLQLKLNGNTREVKLKDFYKGYKSLDKAPSEMIVSVSFKAPAPGSLFSFEKVSRRTYLDIASVNSSMYIEAAENIITDIKISAGGVAPIPFFLSNTCSFILNKKVTSEVITEAAAIAQSEISPISDARGSADYKSLLLHQIIFAHFLKLFPQQINIEELV